jgi:hypothetical protein
VATALDGSFRFDGLPPDSVVWLQAQDDRYALSTFPVTAGAAEYANITLSEQRLLIGRVTAADTRQPLPGARVSVVTGTRPAQSLHYTTLATGPDAAAAAPLAELSGYADGEGRIHLRLPPADHYSVFVYPPDGTPYCVGGSALAWSNSESIRQPTFSLQPGVEICGEVVEEDGRRIAGACVYYMRPMPQATPFRVDDRIPFRDTATFTGGDGRFRIVVPEGRCRLEVFGPSADYRPHSFDYEPCPYCSESHLVRVFEHAFAPLNAALGDRPEPMRLTLRRGTTIRGRVVGPDGAAIREAVAVCRSVAQPLRGQVPRTLPVRDGAFELPGCVPGRTYPVLLLDAARRLGAVTDLRVLGPGETSPTVRMAECGTARVRLVDAVGRPLVGHRPLVRVWIPDDTPSENSIASKTWPRQDPIFASWFDTVNYLSGPKTDADGIAVLPALVPGLEYRVDFAVDGRWYPRSSPFRVAPGQTVRLPDVVVNDDGNGGHTGGTP